MTNVRLGIVGLGARAETLLVSLFASEGVDVVAVCDVSEAAVAKAMGIFTKSGRRPPDACADCRELLRRDDVDAVLIPTSWNSDFTNGKWINRRPAAPSRWSLDDVYPECFERGGERGARKASV